MTTASDNEDPRFFSGRIEIHRGPSGDVMWDAGKYAFGHQVQLVNLTMEAVHVGTDGNATLLDAKIKVVGVRHDDGSGKNLLVTANMEFFLPSRPNKRVLMLGHQKFLYDAHLRSAGFYIGR